MFGTRDGTEADPKRRDLDGGGNVTVVTQLACQKASLPVLKERSSKNAELDLRAAAPAPFSRTHSEF